VSFIPGDWAEDDGDPFADTSLLGDLFMPASAFPGDGTVENGVIRRTHSIQVPWDYTNTVEPTDTAIGTALLVGGTVTASGSSPPGFSAPVVTGHPIPGFGRRGIIQLEPFWVYEDDVNIVGRPPIGFNDAQWIQNDPGVPLQLRRNWSYQSGVWVVADGAACTLHGVDIGPGVADFVSNPVFTVLNGGTLDGVGSGFLSIGFLSGGVIADGASLFRRIGLSVRGMGGTGSIEEHIGVEVSPQDLNMGTHRGFVDTPAFVGAGTVDEIFGFVSEAAIDTGTIAARTGLYIADATGSGIVATQVGVDIEFLDAALFGSTGLRNASNTILTPRQVDIDAASDQIPRAATVLRLNNTTGSPITLTSTPTIGDVGASSDGQVLILFCSSVQPVTLQDGPTFNLRLGAATRELTAGDSLMLMFSSTLGDWVELAYAGSN